MPAPSLYVTRHEHRQTDRTRARVTVVDDGPVVRVHLLMRTSYGLLDLAMLPDAARDLAAELAEGARLAEDYWKPEPADYIEGGGAA